MVDAIAARASVSCALCLALLLSEPATAQQESPHEILAATVRTQGFPCDRAVSAERDPASTSSDEAAWILRCDNATYRVKLIPHQAAHIDRIR